jgi:hypothetical protein
MLTELPLVSFNEVNMESVAELPALGYRDLLQTIMARMTSRLLPLLPITWSASTRMIS